MTNASTETWMGFLAHYWKGHFRERLTRCGWRGAKGTDFTNFTLFHTLRTFGLSAQLGPNFS